MASPQALRKEFKKLGDLLSYISGDLGYLNGPRVDGIKDRLGEAVQTVGKIRDLCLQAPKPKRVSKKSR